MSAVARRAGSRILNLLARAADPTAFAAQAQVYVKAGNAGENNQLYVRSGSGIVQKITGTRAITPTDYIDGAELSWTSVSEVTVAPAFVRSSDDTYDIYLAASQVVDIARAGAKPVLNGLDAGAEAADTWYAVYVIGDSTGVNAGATILSANFTTPTLPAGYNVYRRIGAVRNNAGSNFIKFNQVWNGPVRRYWYDVDVADVALDLNGGHEIAFFTVTLTALMPPTSQACFLSAAFLAPTVGGAVTDLLTLRPTGANATDGPINIRAGVLGATGGILTSVECPTSSGQQIDYKVTDADDTAELWFIGFDDEI